MKKIVFLLFITSQLLTAASQPATPYAASSYFQQRVNFNISVTLDDIGNSLDGYAGIDYTNNSPDTLTYIWFHLWPNAYKNDKTAFSDQLLENGRTDFYFSDNDRRGYINRLNFKVNGLTARLEDHPRYIDIARLVLPLPLLPGMTIHITTSFHVKLPYNFSRGGYAGKSFQATQWYPKPAVYDRKGWHPIPYLDQGEFYSEFGSYDVQITVPRDYVVDATGELQTEEEKDWLLKKSKEDAVSPLKNIDPDKVKARPIVKKPVQRAPAKKTSTARPVPAAKEVTTPATKTLRYRQDDVHDFAWFADKKFMVRADTLRLSSGRIISAYAFFSPAGYPVWKNSIRYIKDAVKTRSEWLGEYPFNVVTALEARMGFSGGMEYPTITSISPMKSEMGLDLVIEHEVGHNWNYGILATNERSHPWMDEGMNTFFDNRYMELKYPGRTALSGKFPSGFISSRIPGDADMWRYRMMVALKKDQPIETASENFSRENYDLIAYYKTGLWMERLQQALGRQVFDSCLHVYFARWKFKHPYPEDFKNVVEEVSGKNVDSVFSLLYVPGDITLAPKRDLKVMPWFNFSGTERYRYIFIAPAAGYNYYDKVMLGGVLHNYTLPAERLQFFVSPMYGTKSKQLTGLARLAYNWTTYGRIQKGEFSLSASSFSVDNFTDSTGNTKFLNAGKFVPSLKLIFRERPRSTLVRSLQWKTFFIREQSVSFTRDTAGQTDIITYPESSRYLNQLKFSLENKRVLYPFSVELLAEQGDGFIRTALNGSCFFNYKNGGGMAVRFFAGKFSYLGDKTFSKQFATDRYHLNMSGANGYEDYTYSNYFIGRNEFEGFASQQIMVRDGGFKVRTDLLASKIGKTDNWLAALNFNTGIPRNINPLSVLPLKIPVKVFFDVGTYAEAWEQNAETNKFLYDGGVQVSLLHDLVNIYIPLVYSKVYADYFKSTLPDNRFIRNISFSIDVQNFRLKNIIPQVLF